jgi:phosphoserine phosphatase RsbU/P
MPPYSWPPSKGSLRAQARHAYADLSALIADVDRLVLAASPKHLYASLFYAEYEVATRVLRHVNAGHNPRWCFAGNAVNVFHLESSGTPLSLLQGSQFTSKAFQLETGDVFVAYTDGITETEGPGDESWGQKKLENLRRSAAIECQRKS